MSNASQEQIDKRIREVTDISNSIIDMIRDQHDEPDSPFYEHTIVLWSLVTRVRANVSALIVLIEANNHYACLSILRSLLEDSLIATASNLHHRGYAGVFGQLLSGVRLTNIDFAGRQYNYSQLCDEQDRMSGIAIGTTREWYSFLSSFVHFSQSHLSATIYDMSEDGLIRMVLPMETFEILKVENKDVLNWMDSAESALVQIANLVRNAP